MSKRKYIPKKDRTFFDKACYFWDDVTYDVTRYFKTRFRLSNITRTWKDPRCRVNMLKLWRHYIIWFIILVLGCPFKYFMGESVLDFFITWLCAVSIITLYLIIVLLEYCWDMVCVDDVKKAMKNAFCEFGAALWNSQHPNDPVDKDYFKDRIDN